MLCIPLLTPIEIMFTSRDEIQVGLKTPSSVTNNCDGYLNNIKGRELRNHLFIP